MLSMRLDVHDAATPSPTPKKEEEEEEAAADQAEEGTDVSRNAMPQHLHTHTIIHYARFYILSLHGTYIFNNITNIVDVTFYFFDVRY